MIIELVILCIGCMVLNMNLWIDGIVGPRPTPESGLRAIISMIYLIFILFMISHLFIG